MSSGLEHQECMESLGAYVLGALPEGESARVERHLSGCRECRAEYEWLRVGADALPASVSPVEPPPELKDRVMKVVEAEAELLRAAGAEADQPHRERRRLSARRLRPLVLLGSVAAAAVAIAVVLAISGGTAVRTIEAQVSTGHGHASLVVRGVRAELAVRNLAAPSSGHIDELWVKHGSAPPEPAGTFVVSSGTVRVGRPVRPGDLVLVTEEPGRGTRRPTTRPFITVRA